MPVPTQAIDVLLNLLCCVQFGLISCRSKEVSK